MHRLMVLVWRARQVNTDTHVQEQRAGRKLFGGVMCRSGLQMLGNMLGNTLTAGRTFKDTANTGLLYFNGRLMALMEASKPYEMVRPLPCYGHSHATVLSMQCAADIMHLPRIPLRPLPHRGLAPMRGCRPSQATTILTGS